MTVEISPNVLLLRSENPWSLGLYSDDSIIQKHKDITSFINTFDAESIDAIIHDPPGFRLPVSYTAIHFMENSSAY